MKALIDRRVDAMVEEGLLGEVMGLLKSGLSRDATALQAIGYKEFFPYFENAAPLAECVAALKQASRHYAKRQLTWFRHMPGVVWLPAGEKAAERAWQAWQEFCR